MTIQPIRRSLCFVTMITLGGLDLAATAGGPQFQIETGTRFPVPNPSEYSNQLTIGDLDLDGDLDIIFANGGNFGSAGSPQVQRVYINDGTGHFADESAARIGFSGLCRGVELGDIDRDGDLDAIFVQDFNRQPQLFVNDGNGFFTDATADRLPTMTLSSSRAQFGDIDNDGDLDLYIVAGTSTRFTCGQYRIYINDGAGFFTDDTINRHPLENVCNNMDCIFGDIDNDFDIDIRTGSTGTNNSRLYTNDGSGVFTEVLNVPSDSSCYSYDFGDVDGDGDLDLVGVNAGPGTTELLMENDGAGRYTNVSSQISPNPSQDDNDSKFLDYDNDGDLDLLIARLGSGGEKLYQNDGLGNFTQVSGVVEVRSDSSLDIMVADLTGDGAYDFVTAQGESGSFENQIYVNNGPADTIPPTIVDTEDTDDAMPGDGPFVIRALVIDGMTSDRNFFDGGIELRYTAGDGLEQSVAMLHSGGQVYRGVIPVIEISAVVNYYVVARDMMGNEAVGESRSFTVGGVLGDLNGDGVVAFDDLVQLLSLWGPCRVPADCPADLNGDGDVGFSDLLIMLANWG